MKRSFKLNRVIPIIAGCMLLQTQALASSDVVEAINLLKEKVLSALSEYSKTANSQITTLFDNTFKGSFTGDTSKLEDLSTIDTKINLYVKNFYSWFTTKDFTSLDFSTKNDENKNNISKLLSQGVSYNLQKNILEKTDDTSALLAQPIESGNNNIDSDSLGIDLKNKNISPYGSLGPNSSTASDVPNLNDLIGPASYTDENAQNKAKLFISYLSQSAPPPKNLYIPEKNTAKNQKVTVYLPYASNDLPYTTVDISTKPNFITSDIGNIGDSEYDRMVKYLNSDTKFYQKYKMKVRATNILRTLYIESMLRSYQERTKDLKKKEDKSLVEKEKGSSSFWPRRKILYRFKK